MYGTILAEAARRFVGALVAGHAQSVHNLATGYVRGHRSSSKGRPSNHGRGKGRAGKPYVVKGLRP